MFNRRHLPAVLAAATAALAFAPAALPAPVPASGTVAKVVDGDTLRVRQGGVVRTVDLAGIDAPEPGECFATAATRRLKASVAVGATVRLTFPGRRPGVRAKRFAALVRTDRFQLNRRMVTGGFARTDGADLFASGQALVDAEITAQDAARGLWAACEGFTPVGGTQQSGSGATPPAAGGAPAIPSTPPAAGVPSDTQIRDQFNQLLKGKAVLRETSDSFSLTQRQINFCSNGQYREVVNTIFGTAGGASLTTTDGTWAITRTGAAAGRFTGVIIHLDAQGTADDRDIDVDLLADGSVNLDGRFATIGTNSECA